MSKAWKKLNFLFCIRFTLLKLRCNKIRKISFFTKRFFYSISMRSKFSPRFWKQFNLSKKKINNNKQKYSTLNMKTNECSIHHRQIFCWKKIHSKCQRTKERNLKSERKQKKQLEKWLKHISLNEFTVENWNDRNMGMWNAFSGFDPISDFIAIHTILSIMCVFDIACEILNDKDN